MKTHLDLLADLAATREADQRTRLAGAIKPDHPKRDMAERFWEKVQKSDGCWLWQAGGIATGYGRFWDGSRDVLAHRWSYTQAKGDIPDGLVLDHLCRTPACVNPDHLEAVTHRENVLRGVAQPAINYAKTECDHGHPFVEGNIYWRGPGHHRRCRTCHLIQTNARGKAIRAAKPKKPRGSWSPLLDECRECGTTERPHVATGLCNACYMRGKRARKAALKATLGRAR